MVVTEEMNLASNITGVENGKPAQGSLRVRVVAHGCSPSIFRHCGNTRGQEDRNLPAPGEYRAERRTPKAAAVSTGIVNDNAPSDPRNGSQFSSPPMVLLAAQIVGMLPMNKTINRVKVRSIPCGKYVRRG